MQTFARPCGEAVSVPIRRRPLPLTESQARARRNALWLHAFERGLPDAVTGEIRPHSTAELALLWGKTQQAVLNGLASARALRAYVREVARGE